MLFHSFQFFVFFIVVYILYLALPHRWQNRMLLAASYVFYGAWDWRYLSLILLSTVVDYFCGLKLEKLPKGKKKRSFLILSIVVNLSLLFTFKYYDFFAGNFQNLMGYFGVSVYPYFLNVVLPVGISFYTFQTMSYTVDVYRGKLPAARNFFDFALYVSFFPQLVAGPIERGTRLLPALLNARIITKEKVAEGVYLFFWGLFLKVFIADNLAMIVDPVFAQEGPFFGGTVLLAVYAFAFQIFCDFSGYSLMAIGLAAMMGIDLMVNFKRPYFSKNISDFWRRWHISLSSWFRDYVFSPFYIYLQNQSSVKSLPLKVRHGIAFIVTLFAAEFLLGLWHGAGWNYAFFGVYHAFLIWSYYYLKKVWDRFNGYVQIFLTFQIACYGWLIFRSTSLQQVWSMTHDLFFNWGSLDADFIQLSLKLTVLTSFVLFHELFEEIKNNRLVIMLSPRYVRYFCYVAMGSLMMVFGHFGERKFIYFQF